MMWCIKIDGGALDVLCSAAGNNQAAATYDDDDDEWMQWAWGMGESEPKLKNDVWKVDGNGKGKAKRIKGAKRNEWRIFTILNIQFIRTRWKFDMCEFEFQISLSFMEDAWLAVALIATAYTISKR